MGSFIVIHPKLLLGVLLWLQRKESPMDHGQLSMVADKFHIPSNLVVE